MTEAQRQRIGIVGIAVGVALFFAGVFAAHFTGLSETNAVGQEIYPHIPRCAWFETSPCWMLPIASQAVAFVGFQVAVAAIIFGWIWDRPSTWAGATIGAFLFTLEVIVMFGIVPNQWLGLTQGTLAWSEQKIFLTIPSWLVLNNEVHISYGVLKDVVAGGYSAGLLGAIAVGAYKLQERSNKPASAKPQPVSGYGRPLVKGDG